MSTSGKGIVSFGKFTWLWIIGLAFIVLRVILCPPPSIEPPIIRRRMSLAEIAMCNRTCQAFSATGSAYHNPKASPYPFNDFDVTWNDDDCEQEYDFEEFEMIYQQRRINKVNLAIQWSFCSANPWPELDLPWCIADWDDGVLVPKSFARVGETCWWCELSWNRNLNYLGRALFYY